MYTVDYNPKKVKRAIMRSSEASATAHTHSNKAILDGIALEDITAIYTANTAIANVATALNISLNSNGTISSDIRDANILPYYLSDTTEYLVDASGNNLIANYC